MHKVEMIVGGRRALVDADMVKKMTRKGRLVRSIQSMQADLAAEKNLSNFRIMRTTMDADITALVRLNRTIRQTVQFIEKSF